MAMVGYGFIASGGSGWPLNLGSGILTCGSVLGPYKVQVVSTGDGSVWDILSNDSNVMTISVEGGNVSQLRLDDGNQIAQWSGKFTAASIGVGNSASAISMGSLVKKFQIFDASGNSLGYIPIYSS